MKFKIGDRVRFRGKRHPDNSARFVAVYEDGPDTFEAVITENIMGICWGLRWDDRTPLGLPFSNSQLEKV